MTDLSQPWPARATPATLPATQGGAWRQITLDAGSRTIRLPEGCALDLGGIAKGMAVDSAIDLMGQWGVRAALVSAGGDLRVCGLPPGLARMGHSCRRRRGRGQVVRLVRGALATIRYRQARVAARCDPAPPSHRPANGQPVENDLREVTVAASSCKEAEAGAKAAFVLGSDLGQIFLRRHRLAGRLTRADRTRAFVGAWPSLLAGGRVTAWSAITWDTARAGGFLAYILLTLAVAAGLVLRNRWQSTRWPRFVTNELHGYLSLLALVFITVHVLAVLVDPFTRFGLAEILVPLWSHYRPVWMGLGTVALYLLVAVWLSSQLRARISHRTWREDPCPCLWRLRSGNRAWTRNWKRHTYRHGR